MSYDSETEAAGRHDAALARAEAWQAQYEMERLAEQVFAERSERASRRRAPLPPSNSRKSDANPNQGIRRTPYKQQEGYIMTIPLRRRLVFVLLAVALIASTVVLMAGRRAGAHTNISNAATCEGVTAGFESFPDATNTIGISGDDGTHADKTFTGTSGSVTATWAELGVDVAAGGVHVYDFYWTVDGGGHAGPFTFDAAVCVPPPPPPPPPPPVTPDPVLIPPAVIERSEAAAPVVAATLPYTG